MLPKNASNKLSLLILSNSSKSSEDGIQLGVRRKAVRVAKIMLGNCKYNYSYIAVFMVDVQMRSPFKIHIPRTNIEKHLEMSEYMS